MARSCLTIILAAGDGTRMRSKAPKVLHPVARLPMICHVLKSAVAAGGDAIAIVTGSDAGAVEQAALGAAPGISIYRQLERKGTAHAVLAAREALQHGYDDVLVLFGDTPLIRPETLKRMRRGLEHGAEVAVLGFHTEDATGYGRLIEKNGELVAIREHREASPDELAIRFCNGGIMAFGGSKALTMLERISNDNSKSEFYLTDLVEVARTDGRKVVAMEAGEEEILGINNRVELARAEAIWQARRRDELMMAGVTLLAPDSVHLSHDTKIGADSIVEPFVVFGPGVTIGENVKINAYSHLEGCTIEAGASVGPFARIRPGTTMAGGSRIGNFVEVKNTQVGTGAKINHLSYVGDAQVGARANIGAGTITCNYDGFAKHRTEIGEGAFIGSNSAMVAPVKIGDGAYVATGSVITEDVPADALGVARSRQVNKPGHAAKLRARAAKRPSR